MKPSIRKSLLKLREAYTYICSDEKKYTVESIEQWEDCFYSWLTRLSCQELLDLLEFFMKSRHLPPF